MEQARFWTWRTMEIVGMKHKPSRKPSKLTGSQKQQSSCEPCFAHTQEIHALGVNRREGQNVYDGSATVLAGQEGSTLSFGCPQL